MAGNRTPTNAKTRCRATEGAQQCLKAEHSKVQNHTWGARGETPQWRADGTPKPDRERTEQLPRVPEGGFVDVPESPMDAAAMQTPATPDPAGPTVAYARPNLGHPDPEGFLEDHQADPPRTVTSEQAREQLRAEGVDPEEAAGEWFDGEATASAAREQARIERNRAEARASGEIKSATVDDDDRRDLERLRSHPDVAQSAPVRRTAADLPGHSIGDITADDAMDSVLFDDTESQLKLERIWLRTAARTILRIGAERHRYGKLADAEQLMALRDQVEHLLTNRGLVRGGGSA
jgi:hypothetical protein